MWSKTKQNIIIIIIIIIQKKVYEPRVRGPKISNSIYLKCMNKRVFGKTYYLLFNGLSWV